MKFSEQFDFLFAYVWKFKNIGNPNFNHEYAVRSGKNTQGTKYVPMFFLNEMKLN